MVFGIHVINNTELEKIIDLNDGLDDDNRGLISVIFVKGDFFDNDAEKIKRNLIFYETQYE